MIEITLMSGLVINAKACTLEDEYYDCYNCELTYNNIQLLNTYHVEVPLIEIAKFVKIPS